MIKRFTKGLILLLAVLIVSFAVYYIRFRMNPGEVTFVPDTSSLNDCDVILRKGVSLASMAVCVADSNADYSHIGIIVFTDDRPYVIHAVPGDRSGVDRVKLDPLANFLSPKRASAMMVYRSDLSPESLQMVRSEALSFIEEEVLFDDEYDINTDDKLYCSELVIKAFSAAGLNLGNDRLQEVDFTFFRHKLILPSFIHHEKNFYQIIP